MKKYMLVVLIFTFAMSLFYGQNFFTVMGANGKKALVDENGKELTPYIYDVIEDFSEGLAKVGIGGTWVDVYVLVYTGGKYGYIDTKGKVVIPIRYDKAEDFKNGAALVKLNDESFYIDKKGSRVEKSGKVKYDIDDDDYATITGFKGGAIIYTYELGDQTYIEVYKEIDFDGNIKYVCFNPLNSEKYKRGEYVSDVNPSRLTKKKVD